MKNKTVTGPFWAMLGIAVFAGLWNYIAARIVLKVTHVSPLIWLLLFFWPILLFMESIVYWRLRRKILYAKYAWGHVLFIFLAFLIPPLVRISNVLYSGVVSSRELSYVRAASKISYLFFWSLNILGHVFFGMMLKKSLSKRPVVQQDPENINLLDDVLN